MNLTKCFVAGLCLMAMTASAGVGIIKTNAFEGDFSTGWWVGDGKYLEDQAVTNTVAERELYEGGRPMTNAANNFVLHLNTEGAVWTNMIGETGVSLAADPIYTDMLVKFVPSETLPDIADPVKLAIAITNGYLVVTKNSQVDVGGSNTWASTSTAISTSLWYRVTVKLEYVYSPSTLIKASIRVNGTDVSVDGNTSWNITDNSGLQTFTAIGFQGTGYIDEVVVRDDDPFGAVTPPPVVMITLSFTTGIQSVLVSGTGTNAAPVVPSGTALDVIASTFYQLAGWSGVTNEWTSLVGDPPTNGTITVTADAPATATFTAEPWTSTNALGWGSAFVNAPATNVAAWAIANSLTSLDDNIYNNYLLNISTNSLPQLLIKSVAVTNSTVTVTVEAAGVDFSDINGQVKLMVSPVLGGTSSNITAAVSGSFTATVQADIGTNKFVKAVVE